VLKFLATILAALMLSACATPAGVAHAEPARVDPGAAGWSAAVLAAPADMVAALGALDRTLFLVASRKLIVVRTGQAAPDRDINEKLWRFLVRAMPPS